MSPSFRPPPTKKGGGGEAYQQDFSKFLVRKMMDIFYIQSLLIHLSLLNNDTNEQQNIYLKKATCTYLRVK